MDFKLLGRTVTISDGTKAYLDILHDFQSMGRQAEADFKAEYQAVFGLVIFNGSYAEKFKQSYGSDHYMDKIVMRYVSSRKSRKRF